MDAISFVLGIRATQLRGTQLKDLMYRVFEGSEAKEAYVILVFQPLSEEGALINCYKYVFLYLIVGSTRKISGEKEGDEISFKRTITAKGTSNYYIDNAKASWEDYNDRLAEFNILIKARNFLVFQVRGSFICKLHSFLTEPHTSSLHFSFSSLPFLFSSPQGDVESIASKSPKDLTEMIEQISGSNELKKEYDDMLLEKERAEETTIFNFQKRKGITNEKRLYKEQKEEAERFNKLLAEQVRLVSAVDDVANSLHFIQKQIQLDHMLFQLFHIKKRVEKNEEKVNEQQKKLADVEDRREVIDKELKGKKKEQAKHHKEVTDLVKKIAKKRKEADKVVLFLASACYPIASIHILSLRTRPW